MAGLTRRQLSKEDALSILSIQPMDINRKLLVELFANTDKRKAKYLPTDEFIIPPEYSKMKGTPLRDKDNSSIYLANNWPDIRVTTVGRHIASLFLFRASDRLRIHMGYITSPLNKKGIGALDAKLTDLYMMEKITIEDIITYIDHAQWLGYVPTRFITPSMTIDTIRLSKKGKALKKSLINSEVGERAMNSDVEAISNIEKTLLNSAKSELENVDPGYDIFESGCRGSFGNNYKNTAVMRGAMTNIGKPGEFNVSMASLDEGIPMEEMHQYADMVVQASYGRGVQTAQGGYISKQLNFAFQSLTLNPDPKSDCRTPLTQKITIENPKDFKYRFVKEGNNLTMVTPDNLGKYKDKVVQLRTPLYCSDKTSICAKCAGMLYHKLGIENFGLVSGNIGAAIMGAAMKSFHDMSVVLVAINLDDYSKEL